MLPENIMINSKVFFINSYGEVLEEIVTKVEPSKTNDRLCIIGVNNYCLLEKGIPISQQKINLGEHGSFIGLTQNEVKGYYKKKLLKDMNKELKLARKRIAAKYRSLIKQF